MKIYLVIDSMVNSILLCAILLMPITSWGGEQEYGVKPALVKSQTLVTITQAKKHPAELAVKTPKGSWIYIVFKPAKYSFFPDFEANTSWTFSADKLEGIEYRDGVATMSKVFVDKGKYLFYFADNLETEPENTFSLFYSVFYSP